MDVCASEEQNLQEVSHAKSNLIEIAERQLGELEMELANTYDPEKLAKAQRHLAQKATTLRDLQKKSDIAKTKAEEAVREANTADQKAKKAMVNKNYAEAAKEAERCKRPARQGITNKIQLYKEAIDEMKGSLSLAMAKIQEACTPTEGPQQGEAENAENLPAPSRRGRRNHRN